jgi:hypothetical protein
MKIKKLLAIIAAMALTASSAALSTAIAVGEPVKVTSAEPVTEAVKGSSSGVYKGYTYSSWGDKSDNVSMKLGKKGDFSCEWQNTKLAKFSRGTDTFTSFYDGDNVTMNATASVNAEGSYFIGESFKYHRTYKYLENAILIMAYDGLDFLLEYRPIAENSKFTAYLLNRNIFDDEDENCDKQLLVLCKDGKGKRDIDISTDISEYIRVIRELISSEYGDNQLFAPELCVYGFNGSGTAEITKNSLTVEKPAENTMLEANTEYKAGFFDYRLSANDSFSGSATMKERGSVELIWENEKSDAFAIFKKSIKLEDIPDDYYQGKYDLTYGLTCFNIEGDCVSGGYWLTDHNEEIYEISCWKKPSFLEKATPVAQIENEYTGENKHEVYVIDAKQPDGSTVKQYWLRRLFDYDEEYFSYGYSTDINELLQKLDNIGITTGRLTETGSFIECFGKGSGYARLEYLYTMYTEKTYEMIHKEYCRQDDIDMLQKYLLGEDIQLYKGKNYDINYDGKVDVYDLTALRRKCNYGGNEFPHGVDYSKRARLSTGGIEETVSGDILDIYWNRVRKAELTLPSFGIKKALDENDIKRMSAVCNQIDLRDNDETYNEAGSLPNVIDITFLNGEKLKIKIFENALELNGYGFTVSPKKCRELNEFVTQVFSG